MNSMRSIPIELSNAWTRASNAILGLKTRRDSNWAYRARLFSFQRRQTTYRKFQQLLRPTRKKLGLIRLGTVFHLVPADLGGQTNKHTARVGKNEKKKRKRTGHFSRNRFLTPISVVCYLTQCHTRPLGGVGWHGAGALPLVFRFSAFSRYSNLSWMLATFLFSLRGLPAYCWAQLFWRFNLPVIWRHPSVIENFTVIRLDGLPSIYLYLFRSSTVACLETGLHRVFVSLWGTIFFCSVDT